MWKFWANHLNHLHIFFSTSLCGDRKCVSKWDCIFGAYLKLNKYWHWMRNHHFRACLQNCSENKWKKRTIKYVESTKVLKKGKKCKNTRFELLKESSDRIPYAANSLNTRSQIRSFSWFTSCHRHLLYFICTQKNLSN